MKDKILAYIKKHQPVTSQDLVHHVHISRQAIHKHLKPLIRSGIVEKRGVTKGVTYQVVGDKKSVSNSGYHKIYNVRGLKEDFVLDEIETSLALKSALSPNAYEVFSFAFTEMMNNVIDHSQSFETDIIVSLKPYDIEFTVRDYGLGLFHTIYENHHLEDEFEAMQQVIKGKLTTDPQRHTGEGLFFSSRASDLFRINSHRILLEYTPAKDEWSVKQKRFLKGTEVTFELSRKTKKVLSDIFNTFAPPEFDYQFGKSTVQVNLFGKNLVSRSQAKRMLAGLDKFQEIVLDFRGVQSLGQGFADEIFRVFQKINPQITLIPIHTNPAIAQMMKHVVDNKI